MLIGNKIIHNGIIVEAIEPSLRPNAVIIYEVIRVVDGVCLFLEDHLARLMNSARLAGEKMPLTEAQLSTLLRDWVRETRIYEGNFKLLFEFTGNNTNYYAHFIPHYYPSLEEYQLGVKTLSLKAERPNPNAKIWNSELKQKADKMLSDGSTYEAVLFDFDGYITEGSKSNLFFVKDDTIITAPYNRVLPGITRKYVLQACIRLKLDIDERCLHYKELPSLQGAFISGTSPKVLPISKIDSYAVPVDNHLLRAIMSEYNSMLAEYIANHK